MWGSKKERKNYVKRSTYSLHCCYHWSVDAKRLDRLHRFIVAVGHASWDAVKRIYSRVSRMEWLPNFKEINRTGWYIGGIFMVLLTFARIFTFTIMERRRSPFFTRHKCSPDKKKSPGPCPPWPKSSSFFSRFDNKLLQFLSNVFFNSQKLAFFYICEYSFHLL